MSSESYDSMIVLLKVRFSDSLSCFLPNPLFKNISLAFASVLSIKYSQ